MNHLWWGRSEVVIIYPDLFMVEWLPHLMAESRWPGAFAQRQCGGAEAGFPRSGRWGAAAMAAVETQAGWGPGLQGMRVGNMCHATGIDAKSSGSWCLGKTSQEVWKGYGKPLEKSSRRMDTNGGLSTWGNNKKKRQLVLVLKGTPLSWM